MGWTYLMRTSTICSTRSPTLATICSFRFVLRVNKQILKSRQCLHWMANFLVSLRRRRKGLYRNIHPSDHRWWWVTFLIWFNIHHLMFTIFWSFKTLKCKGFLKLKYHSKWRIWTSLSFTSWRYATNFTSIQVRLRVLVAFCPTDI